MKIIHNRDSYTAFGNYDEAYLYIVFKGYYYDRKHIKSACI